MYEGNLGMIPVWRIGSHPSLGLLLSRVQSTGVMGIQALSRMWTEA